VSTVLSRIAALALALVIGAVYGTAATVAHSYALGWFPLGLILATVGSAALLVALRLLTKDRWMALAGGLGILGVAFLFSQIGPGGSAIVAPQSAATEWVALAWTLVVPALLAFVVAWPDLSSLRAAREAGAGART
jgi:hypothetical protein